MRELREATASESGMQIGADQGQLLATPGAGDRARRAMEIGTFTGYSALAVALALPKDGKHHLLRYERGMDGGGKPFWKKAGVEEIDLRIGRRSKP